MDLRKLIDCLVKCLKESDVSEPEPVKPKDNVKELMSKFNWDIFDSAITTSKSKPCGEVLEKSEIAAISYLIEAFYVNGWTDYRLLAYALATVRLECGRHMMPVRECFAKDDATARACVKKAGREYAKVIDGHVYYGRGFVQLTWRSNYEKEGIENNPDKALEPDFAARLLFAGLVDGRWNGRKKGLFYYLDELKNPVEARRTVNGLNKAELVASWYYDFLHAINNSVSGGLA
jgi:hypothetical protein